MNGFDDAWLAGIGADRDGRREFPRVAPQKPVDVTAGTTRDDARSTRAAAGGIPARAPARQLSASRPGATAGQHAQAAASAVNAVADAGPEMDGDACAPRKHTRPEEALQAAIVREFRHMLVPGARLFATNGELPGGTEQVRRAGRRKAMGYMRGTPDLCARREGFLGWLECKAGYNKPTDEQVQWAEWAQRDCGDGYAVIRSVEDAGAVLRIWGMLA